VSVLEDIEFELNLRGLKRGSVQFEVEFTKRHVEKCQEMKAVSACFSCEYFDHCELAKKHLRNERARAFAAGMQQGQKDAEAARIIGEVPDE